MPWRNGPGWGCRWRSPGTAARRCDPGAGRRGDADRARRDAGLQQPLRDGPKCRRVVRRLPADAARSGRSFDWRNRPGAGRVRRLGPRPRPDPGGRAGGRARLAGFARVNASRGVGLALAVSIAGSLALVVIYVVGGSVQQQGIGLALALGGMGTAIVIWAVALI